MSKWMVGNLLLAASLVLGSSAHVILNSLTNRIGPLQLNRQTLSAIGEPWNLCSAGAVIAMLAIAFGFWVFSLSRLPLSYAYPVACSSALIVTLLSAVFLKEPVAGTMLLRP